MKIEIPKQAVLDALAALESETLTPEQLHALAEAVTAMELAKDPEAAKPEEPEAEEPGEMEMAAASQPVADAKPLAEAPPPGDMPPADPAAVPSPEADAGAMLIAKLTEATGMDAAALMAALDANLEAVAAALKGAPAPAAATDTAALSVRLLSDQLAAVKGRLAKYEAAEADARARALAGEVDSLIQAGRILPGARDQWLALAHRDHDGFRALTSTLPVVVPMGREATALTAPQPASESMAEAAADEEALRALTDRFKRDWRFDESRARAAAERQLAAMKSTRVGSAR